MKNAINVISLKKSYKDKEVLHSVSFEVNKGEIFALLGVNGAGKTTALECIEGLRKYDSGSIEINGKAGIQLQSASLPEHIKALEAVKLFAKWNKAIIDKDMLDTLGINELAKKRYVEMSTGQKRRLHLALSLINNPDIVFLDEPTAGLDVEGRIALHKQIRKLKASGKTIILASHDMAEVEELCDRIAILNGGNIIFCGSVQQLNEKLGKRYSICIKTAQQEESFTADSIADTLLLLLKDYKQKGIDILDIKIDRGTLEQHFVEMTRSENK